MYKNVYICILIYVYIHIHIYVSMHQALGHPAGDADCLSTWVYLLDIHICLCIHFCECLCIMCVYVHLLVAVGARACYLNVCTHIY